jgi:hypothetical protein
MYVQSQTAADMKRDAPFDLFKMIGADGVPIGQEYDDNDTKVILDLMKLKDLGQFDPDEIRQGTTKCQDDSKGHDQIETESESYTKLEIEMKKEKSKKSKKEGKKTNKSDINQLITDERRRLLKKLDT